MLHIHCEGSPYQVGLRHGNGASIQISRSIAFYEKLFQVYSKQSWDDVCSTARAFISIIENKWPRYLEEMKGVAEGSNRDLLDIVALNVRTEIAFGLFNDGCTSMSWKTRSNSWLAQNWDWMEPQKENLIILTIDSPHIPTIKMITEAGIIGKIGFNSVGVGVCLNAIKATGLDASRMPVHLGLRLALESESARDAVNRLQEHCLASSAFILIADATTSTGFESTSTTCANLAMDENGRIVHSNHLILDHPGVKEPGWLADSRPRINRMQVLLGELGEAEPSFDDIRNLFDDHDGFPCSICRWEPGPFGFDGTLFNIVMDLGVPRAVLRLGRPCNVDETLMLTLEAEI